MEKRGGDAGKMDSGGLGSGVGMGQGTGGRWVFVFVCLLCASVLDRRLESQRFTVLAEGSRQGLINDDIGGLARVEPISGRRGHEDEPPSLRVRFVSYSRALKPVGILPYVTRRFLMDANLKQPVPVHPWRDNRIKRLQTLEFKSPSTSTASTPSPPLWQCCRNPSPFWDSWVSPPPPWSTPQP